MEIQMMSAPLPVRARALRRALLIGSAIGAACLGAGEAGAQAFNGNPTTIAGFVAYDRATPGVETIRVDTNTAIINWTPNVGGNPILFLPQGNVATFTNGVSNTDFVVLNRIIADPAIRFDGTVLSQIQDAALGTTRTGGTVIFSSPGGIIIGAKAVFDVGSLVLTSLNVVDDGTGNFYDPATRGLAFAPFVGFAGGAVVTEQGAQIRALEQSSFVAMVAPTIRHGGSVRVNGSAAYIAGESVQMRVNQGLFDIIVDVGSDNSIPLVHLGTTGGPASNGATDPHAIYLVAMPKNQAITAILEGDTGFDPAVAVGVENGVIVLSAGANVVGGAVDRYGHLTGTPAADLQASFQINGGIVRSDLIGTARTDMSATPGTAPSLNFLQDVSLFGERSAILSAGAGQTLNVQGNALVSAAAFDSANPLIFNLIGGTANIFTQNGGNIHIFGTATVDASARGRIDPVGNGGSGTGGAADVSATGGVITIDGALAILATGEGGGAATTPGAVAGAGIGGEASLVASASGRVVANGGVAIIADGVASASDGSGGTNGTIGRGGGVLVGAGSGGALTLIGAVNASASGQGGGVQSGPGLTGGLGLGGTIAVRGQGGTVSFNGNAVFAATGSGGEGPQGGRGQGGDLVIEAAGGSIDFAGTATAAAAGFGGNAAGAAGGAGGDGQGGTINVVARTSATVSRIGGGALSLTAPGVGGQGGSWGGVAGVAAGTGGNGTGGAITLLAESGNGRIALGAVTAAANGIGGNGGDADNDDDGGRGGSGAGGSVLVGMAGGPASASPAGIATFASLDASAGGAGGSGGNGRGRGGDATGGSVALSATGASVTLSGPAALVADGNAGAGGNSFSAGFGAIGQAAGGILNVGAFAHAQSGIAGTLTLSDVTGSASGLGNGNGYFAGAWHLSAIGGDVSATNVTLNAVAGGTGPGPAPASTIDAQSGTVTLNGVSTLTTDGDILLTATGAGRVAGGRINLVSGRDVVVAHNAPVANALTVDVTDLFIRAADDVTVNAGVATRASNATDIRAVDLATIAGRVVGRQVNIGSADLDLPATGVIGDAATELVVLQVAGGTTPPGVPAGATTLGGTAQGPGYTLTGAEAGRIRAGILRVLAPALSANPARAPDLVVRDLTLNGGGAAAGIGTLEILTPGIARVEGNLLLTGARPQDGIVLAATERLEVPTPAGSIRVRAANGAPAGTLRLASNNLWVASAAIIDALRANPNFAGRDDALLDNGGTEVPRGYVEAGGVTLVSGGTLYVQNTGSTARFTQDFAGITVGAGGLTITAAAPGTNVTAFGRRLNPDGSFTVGDAFFAQSTYNNIGGAGAPGSFTPAAALNTCIIVTGRCAARPPAAPIPGGADSITGTTGNPDDGASDGSSALPAAAGAGQDDLVDSSFAADPLIEEPVTSGGEAGLWDCDPDQDGDCDDD